ncbi:Hypothetical predicted protein [Paramuricea clavata]|uniref:Uncharacterized protein n=1 Tax=Paramuricea clavata TaxID=317549 RepID=A0A7D9LGQ4_PARCT|nr:Hypothetical predicted protein [Paramuricea clavata]
MAEKRLHETESSEYDSNIDSKRSVSDQDPDDTIMWRRQVVPINACNVNLSCSQGGINGVSTHSKSQKHKSNEKAATSSSLRQFLKKRDDPSIVVHPSIQAEEHFKIELVNDMNSPFSIMIDGSNDNGIAKMYPITVRIYDDEFNRVMTKFFDMNLIEGRLRLGVDNTNVNIGEHDSIKSRVLANEPKVVVVGCPCHMLHDAAGKAANAFGTVTGFDIENHCVDLYYWFDKSTKRKGALKEYFEYEYELSMRLW